MDRIVFYVEIHYLVVWSVVLDLYVWNVMRVTTLMEVYVLYVLMCCWVVVDVHLIVYVYNVREDIISIQLISVRNVDYL